MIKKTIKVIIILLIQIIEFFEYRNLDESQKVVKSFKLPEGYEIETDTGFKPVTYLHQTKRFKKFRIETESGKWIEGADKHIIFDENMNEIFIDQLVVGSLIQTRDGIEKIVSITSFNSKVGMFDLTVEDENHRFYSNDILSHNSIMTAIQILHYCCFNVEKNVLLLANKGKTVEEVLSKIKSIYLKLPLFLKPGIYKDNVTSMSFDNDCKIMTSATTADAGIGFSIDFLYADEFAHVPDNIARSFWKSIYPTLSSLKNSRCIITSTPNGFNLFYELYSDSLKKKNDFANMITYWYDVPGRDEKWKQSQIQNLGGNVALFNQEFGCQFTTENTILLDKNTIKRLNDNSVKYEHFVIDSFEDVEDLFYDNLKWHPEHYDRLMNGKFDKDGYPIFEEQRFVLAIDLAEGIGQDYSIINIFEISTMTEEEMRKLKRPKKDTDFIKLVQVGVFRSNTQKISDIARITMELVRLFGEDETLINYETNYNGDYFYKCLEDDEDFFSDLCIKTRHTQDARRPKPGVKMTRNKVNYCKDSKDLIRLNVVELTEEETVNEFKTFALNKKGSYSSQTGHDDLAMTVVGLIPGMKSDIFDEFAAEIVDTYSDEEVKLIFEIIEEKTNYKEDEIYDFEDEISKSLDPFANPNKLEDKINKQLNKGSIFG